MHSSATRLRTISRVIVITLVLLVGLIIVIHDRVSSGGHAAAPTATPALHGVPQFALRTYVSQSALSIGSAPS
jgi:hypothetical protein